MWRGMELKSTVKSSTWSVIDSTIYGLEDRLQLQRHLGRPLAGERQVLRRLDRGYFLVSATAQTQALILSETYTATKNIQIRVFVILKS